MRWRCCVPAFNESAMASTQELRRGAEAACIYSVAFSRSPVPDWVAVTSDRGTIHVFSLGLADRPALQQQSAARNGSAGGAGTANPVSPLSFVSVSSYAQDKASCQIAAHVHITHQSRFLLLKMLCANVFALTLFVCTCRI